MPRQTRYKGTLARPIENPFDGLYDEQSLIACEEYEAIASQSKFEELFIHYGLNPEDTSRLEGWETLAYLLAFEHVPGLKLSEVRDKGGRPKFLTEEMLRELARDVDHVRTQAKFLKHKTRFGACEYIARSPDYRRWHPPAGKELSAWVPVLVDRYHRGKRLLRSLAD